MNRDSLWTSAGLAMELGLIRFVCEYSIAFFQEQQRYPSPSEIQRAYHAHQQGPEPTPRPT